MPACDIWWGTSKCRRHPIPALVKKYPLLIQLKILLSILIPPLNKTKEVIKQPYPSTNTKLSCQSVYNAKSTLTSRSPKPHYSSLLSHWSAEPKIKKNLFPKWVKVFESVHCDTQPTSRSTTPRASKNYQKIKSHRFKNLSRASIIFLLT